MVNSFDWQFMLHSYLCSIFLLGICFASFFIPIVLHAQRILTCQVPLLFFLILHIPERQSHTLPVEMYSAALVWHFACLLYAVISYIVYFVSFHCITYIHQTMREIDSAYVQYMLEAQTPPVHTTGFSSNLNADVAEAAAYKRMRKRIGRYFRRNTQESVTELLPRIKDTVTEPILESYSAFVSPTQVPSHHTPVPIIKGMTRHKNVQPQLSFNFIPTFLLKNTMPLELVDKQKSTTTDNNSPSFIETAAAPPTVAFIQHNPKTYSTLNVDNASNNSLNPSNSYGSPILPMSAAPSFHTRETGGQSFRHPITRFSSEDLEMSLQDSHHRLFNQSDLSLPTLSFFGSSTSRPSIQHQVRLISRFIPRTKLGLIFSVSYVPSDVIARQAIPASFSFFLFFYSIVYMFRMPGY